MNQQCGNCEWWDKERFMNSPNFISSNVSECKYPAPSSVPKRLMYSNEGQTCPVYEERKE